MYTRGNVSITVVYREKRRCLLQERLRGDATRIQGECVVGRIQIKILNHPRLQEESTTERMLLVCIDKEKSLKPKVWNPCKRKAEL
jgi:hypothetical protein